MHATQTVLVVEGDAVLSGVLCRALAQNGYQILETADAPAALDAAQAHEGTIDLFLCEAILTDTTGPDLAALLRAARRDLRVLYTSGGEMGPAPLLVKPFGSRDLLEKVREVLGG
jgi:DNA-binding response OmpR family regulator